MACAKLNFLSAAPTQRCMVWCSLPIPFSRGRPRPDAYEVDYLITPELGGATDIRNLWPYGDTVWNAHVKDQLEDRAAPDGMPGRCGSDYSSARYFD